MSKLVGEVVTVASLSQQMIDRLFCLMEEDYNGLDQNRFLSDLSEKKWVLILSDGAGLIQGFSTIMILTQKISGREVRGIFSGDTVISRKFRGELILMKTWLLFVLDLAAKDKKSDWYWFLISKGYKTYKLLPLFFQEFYPRSDRAMPASIKAVLDGFGQGKFREEYDAATGLIKPRLTDYLKNGQKEITAHRLGDSHIRYFTQANPNFWRGDELACLAELNPENLTDFGLRLIAH